MGSWKKYSVKELSQLSGITPRTIQYYDNEGILKAERDELGHRVYYDKQLYVLEQIMFYRAIGFSLRKIKEQLIVGTEEQDIENILITRHRSSIHRKRVSKPSLTDCMSLRK